MEWYWIVLITSGGLYITLSIILFIFPACKKKNPIIIPHSNSPIILGAHRGGSFERLENSLPAFKHAKEMGEHIMEMDLGYTKDKKIVVHHDSTLKRLTGLDKKVGDLNYEEIPCCLEEVEYPIGDGIYKQKPGIDDGKIPLLEDVFIQNPGMHMNIDLKGGSEEQIEEVYNMIRKYKREEITYYGDTNEKINKIAQEMGKDAGIRTFASISYTLMTVVFYFLGIIQFFPFRHYSIWYPFFGSEELKFLREKFGGGCCLSILTSIYTCITYLCNPLFWHLRRKGVLVFLFSINREEEVVRALKFSIDGILTDQPKMIKEIIEEQMGDERYELVPTNNRSPLLS